MEEGEKGRLIFKIEGPGQHDLELSFFIKKLEQFRKLLRHGAQEAGADGVRFDIVNLSHSSPATIECMPIDAHNAPVHSVVDSIKESLDSVNNEQANGLSHSFRSALEELAKPDPEHFSCAEILAVDATEKKNTYKLDSPFWEILHKAPNTEERCISTVDGRLEQVNIHDTNTFKIYPSWEKMPPVTCKFKKELLGDVQGALGRYVSVHGDCFYHPEEQSPYKIEVYSLEVLPHSKDLPDWDDIYGIAPDMTGGLSSEDFVRHQRDEWDKE